MRRPRPYSRTSGRGPSRTSSSRDRSARAAVRDQPADLGAQARGLDGRPARLLGQQGGVEPARARARRGGRTCPRRAGRSRHEGPRAGHGHGQLYVDEDDLGALNLYARTPGSFDEESERVGVLFASHAAIAYDAARTQSGLHRSAATRQLIGQAQGILMERHKIIPDRAFALLVAASQSGNVKLREIAEQLVQSGALPRQVVRR